jgi:pimeloyl-ACP methyl ester carboxylesterase
MPGSDRRLRSATRGYDRDVQQTIRHTTAPGGEEIAYASVGDGPVLVIAAWWTSHVELDWQDPDLRSFVETLAQRHTVVRYDRPGVGMSSRGDRPYDLDGETAYLNAVIDAARRDARAEQIDLLGISCGGPGSVRVAAERPDVVRNLVLFGSYETGSEIGDDPTRRALVDLVRANWGMGSQTLTTIFLPGAEPDTIRRFNRSQRETATPEVAAALLELTFALDAADYTARVDAPTLVLHRSRDVVIGSRLGEQLAERIPGAEYRELEGNVHVPWSGDQRAALEHIERFLTGEGPGVRPQRRLATVCFIDIVGSTTILSEIGDARWRERLDALQKVIIDEATSRDGAYLKDSGDGAMLTFTMPGDAFDFAIAVRGRAGALDLPVRIGVHAGEVEIRGDDITGITVVIASRTADLAGADQIFATKSTVDLAAGGGVQSVDVGERDLKGIAGRRDLVEIAPRRAAVPAADVASPGDLIRFGEYEIDPVAYQLRRGGQPIDIEPQVFEVLTYLATRPGELVTREQLLDNVWGDRFVSESSLSSRIRSARVAVGDDGSRQAAIKTVHGRGYRFVASVH